MKNNNYINLIMPLLAFLLGGLIVFFIMATTTTYCDEAPSCEVCEVCEVCPAEKVCAKCPDCVCNNEPTTISVQDAEWYSEQKEICDGEARFTQNCSIQMGPRESPRFEYKNCPDGWYGKAIYNVGCICIERECELYD